MVSPDKIQKAFLLLCGEGRLGFRVVFDNIGQLEVEGILSDIVVGNSPIESSYQGALVGPDCVIGKAFFLLPQGPGFGVRQLDIANTHGGQGVILQPFDTALSAPLGVGFDLRIEIDVPFIQVQYSHVRARMVDAVKLVFE